jgi:hypothetical protein
MKKRHTYNPTEREREREVRLVAGTGSGGRAASSALESDAVIRTRTLCSPARIVDHMFTQKESHSYGRRHRLYIDAGTTQRGRRNTQRDARRSRTRCNCREAVLRLCLLEEQQRYARTHTQRQSTNTQTHTHTHKKKREKPLPAFQSATSTSLHLASVSPAYPSARSQSPTRIIIFIRIVVITTINDVL